jgi:hypothetical protein
MSLRAGSRGRGAGEKLALVVRKGVAGRRGQAEAEQHRAGRLKVIEGFRSSREAGTALSASMASTGALGDTCRDRAAAHRSYWRLGGLGAAAAAAHCACIASAASSAASTSAGEAPGAQAANREEKMWGVCRTPSAFTAVHTSAARSGMLCRWISVSSEV